MTGGGKQHRIMPAPATGTYTVAPHVGADLGVMRADTARARGERPYVFTDLTRLVGVGEVAGFIARAGGLPAPMSDVA